MQEQIKNRLEKKNLDILGPPAGRICYLLIEDLHLNLESVWPMVKQWHEYNG